MGGLFGGGQSTSTESEKLVGIQLQTSSYGGPLKLVYGTNRVSGNVIDYDDFTAVPQTTTQKTGKGGGGSTQTTTTYTYTAMIIMAVCAGPLPNGTSSINRVWRDKDLGSLSGFGLSAYGGAIPGTAWSYLTSNHSAKAAAYSGIFCVVGSAVDLGASGSLKNHSFEVTGLYVGTATGASPDSNAADVITHFLTNAYDGAGWSAGRLGDMTTYRNYIDAAGLWISPVLDEQKEAREHLKMILEATNSQAVWSTNGTQMVLKIVPYGDTNITAHGVTYTANVTPVYDLTPDDFMSSSGEDPINIEIVSQAEAFNDVPIEFVDRALDYNINVLSDPDQTDIDAFGRRVAENVSLKCITRSDVALQISRIKAQRNTQCRSKFKFRLGYKYILLEPMDLVTLTEPIMGLSQVVVRIISVEETEDGYLEIMAENWPFGVAHAALYTTQSGDGTVPNVNAAPGNASAPVIFDAPALMRIDSTQPELWMATAGGPLWGGCEVWVSMTGTTYSKVGDVIQPARYGPLTASLATNGTQSDTTHTLSVNLSISRGTLVNASAQDMNDFETKSWVGGEVLSYQTATLTGANAYNITTMMRGGYGTSISAHTTSDKFVRLDDAVFKYALPASRVGSLVYVKLVSYNIWGGGKEDISTVPVYTYTTTAQSLPAPTGVTVAFSTTRPA